MKAEIDGSTGKGTVLDAFSKLENLSKEIKDNSTIDHMADQSYDESEMNKGLGDIEHYSDSFVTKRVE